MAYRSRVAEELAQKRQTQELITKMEQIEMEMIEKLSNTQSEQRAVYAELESALGATERPISQRCSRPTSASSRPSSLREFPSTSSRPATAAPRTRRMHAGQEL